MDKNGRADLLSIEGIVEKIIYQNEENGYTVLRLVTEEDDARDPLMHRFRRSFHCARIFPFTEHDAFIQFRRPFFNAVNECSHDPIPYLYRFIFCREWCIIESVGAPSEQGPALRLPRGTLHNIIYYLSEKVKGFEKKNENLRHRLRV